MASAIIQTAAEARHLVDTATSASSQDGFTWPTCTRSKKPVSMRDAKRASRKITPATTSNSPQGRPRELIALQQFDATQPQPARVRAGFADRKFQGGGCLVRRGVERLLVAASICTSVPSRFDCTATLCAPGAVNGASTRVGARRARSGAEHARQRRAEGDDVAVEDLQRGFVRGRAGLCFRRGRNAGRAGTRWPRATRWGSGPPTQVHGLHSFKQGKSGLPPARFRQTIAAADHRPSLPESSA